MLRADITEGSGIRGRTVHAEGMYRGRFGVQSRTVHAGDQYRRRLNVDGVNRPRWGQISRMVQCQSGEPSTLGVCIADGPYLRSEPSTLKADIVDSSM